MAKQKSLMRGMLAGMAGGLVAAWMMKEFMTGKIPGQAVPGNGVPENGEPELDKPLGNYAFGVLTGGIYGGLAEYSGIVRSGFGSSYGGVLFSTAVPAFGLSPSAAAATAESSPIAAQVLYGVTTELVRRVVRAIL